MNQADLDRQWTALKKTLCDETLCEQEAYAVLSSGILQTPTGKAVAGLFADAMLRSIRPVGQLSEERLEKIVDVICHLPPQQWQAALGEAVRFSPGQSADSVTGFIQAQLERSGAQRDERIANDELLSDTQWEGVQHVARQARQYIRHSSDSQLNSALMMLEDMRNVRPTPQEARHFLAEFVKQLDNPPPGERVRWPERFPKDVEAVYAQLKPAEQTVQSWLEWSIGPSWLESLVSHPVSLSASVKALLENFTSGASTESITQPQAQVSSTSLLSKLQKFERSADFSTFSPTGPLIPTTLAESFVCVLNVLSAVQPLLNLPSPPPHKLQATQDMPVLPQDPNGETSPANAQAFPSWETLELFAAQADELASQFINSFMPWDSAYAQDVEAAMEMLNEAQNVYRDTTRLLDESQSASLSARMSEMGERLHDWLNRMSVSLVSTGAAVLSQTGDLIERHPRTAIGAVAAYVAVGNFYASWFLPEPQSPDDSPQEALDFDELDEAFVTYEKTIEGIDGLFEEQPEFALVVETLISQSDYLDPADDPQLAEEIEALLMQPMPGDLSVTYQEYIEELIELAHLEALEEFEDDAEGEPTTQPGSGGQTVFDATDPVRKKRSLQGMSNQPAEKGSGPVQWLITAGRGSIYARASGGSDDVIAPALTIKQAADKFVETIEDMQRLSDPTMFIRKAIADTIVDSDLPPHIKSALNFKTKFNVTFETRRGLLEDYKPLYTRRYKEFDLAQLFAGQHRKWAKGREEILIPWPNGYTAEFKNTVDRNNFEEQYKVQSEAAFSQPGFNDLWKLHKQKELHHTLVEYLQGEQGSVEGKRAARNFLNGVFPPQLISIRDGGLSAPDKVSNAVYLYDATENVRLFVFLGGNSTVIEHPVELLQRTKSIEKFPELSQLLSRRIDLKEFLARDEYDFKYSLGYIDPERLKFKVWDYIEVLLNNLKLIDKINGKIPYEAVVIDWGYRDSDSVFEELFNRQKDQVASAIDVLTSTPDERMTDKILELVADVFAKLSICTAFLPGTGSLAAGVSMLFGLASSATDFARGELEDDPEVAAQHKAAALRGAVLELAGPFVGRLVGKELTKSVHNRIGAEVLDRMAAKDLMPKNIAKYFSATRSRNVVLTAAKKIPKWIPPVVKKSEEVSAKINKKFVNQRTVNQINNLREGPEIAQRLMDKTGYTYFASPSKGYVYKGFVMRGDMRKPQVVFADGFKLRTPVKDIGDVNGMRGGFGGGKDALDLDGAGISTSAFYSESGAGAFQYGGKRGGYTYVIDGRDMEGFHLYQNHEWASRPTSKLRHKPYEINYGENIPSSNILGAYDSNGIYIPNPSGVSRSIDLSTPVSGLKKAPVIKNVPIRNSTDNAAYLAPGFGT